MVKAQIRRLAESIFGFEPQFNDKIASLFVPPSAGERPALTRSQAKVLFLLHKNPNRTATELGDALGMTKASLTGILDVLEAQGLAKRAVDGEDRRKLRLSLTAAGLRFCNTKEREFGGRLESRVAPLSEADRAALARHLAAACAILKKLEE